MGADEIIPKIWLGSTLSQESARKYCITCIVQASANTIPVTVCAVYQRAGIEPVDFKIEHSNLLPVFASFCVFIDRRLQSRKKTLILEKGGGAACLVAYAYLSSSLSLVMRAREVGPEEALSLVQAKHRGLEINDGLMQQLKIWRSCDFEVYEQVDGRKVPKKLYVDWIEREVGKRAQSQLDQYCAQT